MNTWTAVALVALGACLTALHAWSRGYREGLARGRRHAAHAEANALGWMRVAIAAERRADDAEALLALDFNARSRP